MDIIVYWQLRKKLRSEQMDREKEQVDQAAMLRELNKNVNDRMIERDDLLHQVIIKAHPSIPGRRWARDDTLLIIIALEVLRNQQQKQNIIEIYTP